MILQFLLTGLFQIQQCYPEGGHYGQKLLWRRLHCFLPVNSPFYLFHELAAVLYMESVPYT